ncbi:hypothetical protein LZC95_02365 [Pendulispora brunnea]|uniref:Tetratricopeptide repeat protein n=1 Tax=Pendulispora brunnea TaxID=2905690 RepID=A0ABZ2KAH7_9BACT
MMKLQKMVCAGVAAVLVCACSSLVPHTQARGFQGEVPERPRLGARIDRMGRALTGNALIEPMGPDDVADRRKEAYNRAAQADWPQFVPDLQAGLALYDGLDGQCGNQWLAATPARYATLARVLADDRIWIDSDVATCAEYLAVERAELEGGPHNDCGGRRPTDDVIDVFRSRLVNGSTAGVDDGVPYDDRVHSATDFPFLAAPAVTTSSVIAIENLDRQIAQRGDEPGVEELLLARARFFADYEALDRASSMAEGRFRTAGDLLRRARARSAVHRFGDALADVEAAERAGSNAEEVAALRASILVAMGRAAEVLPQLEERVARHPGFATRSALAGAYAALNRFEEADRAYVAALGDLDTTLPFPHAWIHFARALMWTERAGEAVRGEASYRQALAHLPEFATANIHLAELEMARGDATSALARLERVVAASGEPEALGLLGAWHVRTGEAERGRREIARARQRFEALLARHPLAFADHAAEFYLGPGADAGRGLKLAQLNLSNRETDRARALVSQAQRRLKCIADNSCK